MDCLEILIGRAERLDHVLIRVLGRVFPGHDVAQAALLGSR
ncbi:hypothetical protein [Streptosporangium sp. NPDC049376]